MRQHVLVWGSTIACLFIAAGGPLLSAEENASDVLEKVRRKYDSIRDAELKFSQRVTFERTRLSQTIPGTLVMKKGNHYRLEVGEQTIVTDGVTVWSHSRGTNQVIIDRFKMSEGSLSPERILTGTPEGFAASILGNERLGSTDVIALKLVPKDEQSFLTELKLWIDHDTWFIRKAEIIDVSGKKTAYEIEDIKMNSGVSDTIFSYDPPEGVDVIDLR